MKQFQSILFLDSETVPAEKSFSSVDVRGQDLFKKRFKNEFKKRVQELELGTSPHVETVWEDVYQNQAGLTAEWGQVCCVSMGYISGDEIRVKSIASASEFEILTETKRIIEMRNELGVIRFSTLCAHNGKEFDFPYLCRRMLFHSLVIPGLLDPGTKKPWDLPWKDTMDIWAFGQWKHKTALDVIGWSLGIPSPKVDMDGSQVRDYFYGLPLPSSEELPFGPYDPSQSNRLADIARYCGGDVVAMINTFLRMNNLPIVPQEKVIYV